MLPDDKTPTEIKMTPITRFLVLTPTPTIVVGICKKPRYRKDGTLRGSVSFRHEESGQNYGQMRRIFAYGDEMFSYYVFETREEAEKFLAEIIVKRDRCLAIQVAEKARQVERDKQLAIERAEYLRNEKARYAEQQEREAKEKAELDAEWQRRLPEIRAELDALAARLPSYPGFVRIVEMSDNFGFYVEMTETESRAYSLINGESLKVNVRNMRLAHWGDFCVPHPLPAVNRRYAHDVESRIEETRKFVEFMETHGVMLAAIIPGGFAPREYEKQYHLSPASHPWYSGPYNYEYP